MTVGILGGTGSSKSTLVQLIPRLYDATQGVVKVGGIDVRQYDLEVLRDQVAMVLQKNVLFSGTIADNLRWGNPNATKLIIAQRVASVEHADLILVLDDGRIVDQGTHTELLNRSPIYQEVYQSQRKGGDEHAQNPA